MGNDWLISVDPLWMAFYGKERFYRLKGLAQRKTGRRKGSYSRPLSSWNRAVGVCVNTELTGWGEDTYI